MEYDKYLRTMPSHHLNLGRFRIFSFLSFSSLPLGIMWVKIILSLSKEREPMEECPLTQLIQLPPVLEPFREAIEQSRTPFIRIQTQRGTPALFESKFGGYPYLPKDFPHPVDEKGNPLRFLAQYRLDHLPPLSDLPTEGMLQFFISTPDDGSLGSNWDNLSDSRNFRVIFHPAVTEDVSLLCTDFSHLTVDDDDEYFPVDREYALAFTLSEEIVGLSDYRFERLDISFSEDEEETVWDSWHEQFSNGGHKIGGYAAFAQFDPRDSAEHEDYSVLLLQIDSEEETDDIMWGDVGVANFFIRPEDLKKRDFSRVLYTWDCG